MKKTALMVRKLAAVLLALTLIWVGAWLAEAQAVTTPTDITTPSDIVTGTDIPSNPSYPSQPDLPQGGTLAITGAHTVRGGGKVTLTATLDGQPISASLVEWAVYPYNSKVCTISRGVVTTRKVSDPTEVQVTAALKSDPTVYCDFELVIRPAVTAVSISAPSTYVDLNGSATVQLKAALEPAECIKGVTWSSGSTKIATVDENGLVTAHKTGRVTITAKAADGSGKSAKITLQVVRGVTDVTITGPTEVAEGKTVTLKAQVLPVDATVDDVVWSVDCPSSVATISSSGKFRARSVDALTQVTVTAASRQNPAIRATHVMTICPEVTRLTITGPSSLIDLDSDAPTLQLTATAQPADASQEVKWSSSSSRATVDENGLVTAKRAGTVTITAKATDGSGVRATYTVRIVNAVKGVTITGATSAASGKTITLKAAVSPSNATNDDVVWSVDCPDTVATISSSGKLSVRKGLHQTVTITVTATSKENPAISDTHQVTIRPAVTSIVITAPQKFIDISGDDKTLQLSASCLPADASQQVKWSCSSSRATVDENGLVTAKRAGTVTITATATDGTGRRGSITLRIVNAVKGVSITGATSVASGKTITLKAVVTPDNATNDDVIWSVDCPSTVATISSSGKLTAKKGIAQPVTITVKAVSAENDAIYATHQVTVRPAVDTLTITAPQTFIDFSGDDRTLQLTAVIQPENASQQVEWSSSSSRATVDENGLVTAHRMGTVKITARATDGTGRKATITIRIVNAVKGLSISGGTEVTGGGSLRLKAVVTPEDATNDNVIWSVDCDKSVATISTSGRLYARKVDAATVVTVTAVSKENPAISATHQVTIRPAVGRISISASRTWIDITSANPTLQLNAHCTPDTAGQGVTWSSSRKGVATVNANGLVTGLKEGTTVITARANDGSGRYTSITVRVIKPITGITITGGNYVTAGHTLRLRWAITPTDATSKKLVWSVNCPSSVATVSNGVVSAKDVDQAYLIVVTAASADDPSVKASFQVMILPEGIAVPAAD